MNTIHFVSTANKVARKTIPKHKPLSCKKAPDKQSSNTPSDNQTDNQTNKPSEVNASNSAYQAVANSACSLSSVFACFEEQQKHLNDAVDTINQCAGMSVDLTSQPPYYFIQYLRSACREQLISDILKFAPLITEDVLRAQISKLITCENLYRGNTLLDMLNNTIECLELRIFAFLIMTKYTLEKYDFGFMPVYEIMIAEEKARARNETIDIEKITDIQINNAETSLRKIIAEKINESRENNKQFIKDQLEKDKTDSKDEAEMRLNAFATTELDAVALCIEGMVNDKRTSFKAAIPELKSRYEKIVNKLRELTRCGIEPISMLKQIEDFAHNVDVFIKDTTARKVEYEKQLESKIRAEISSKPDIPKSLVDVDVQTQTSKTHLMVSDVNVIETDYQDPQQYEDMITSVEITDPELYEEEDEDERPAMYDVVCGIDVNVSNLDTTSNELVTFMHFSEQAKIISLLRTFNDKIKSNRKKDIEWFFDKYLVYNFSRLPDDKDGEKKLFASARETLYQICNMFIKNVFRIGVEPISGLPGFNIAYCYCVHEGYNPKNGSKSENRVHTIFGHVVYRSSMTEAEKQTLRKRFEAYMILELFCQTFCCELCTHLSDGPGKSRHVSHMRHTPAHVLLQNSSLSDDAVKLISYYKSAKYTEQQKDKHVEKCSLTRYALDDKQYSKHPTKLKLIVDSCRTEYLPNVVRDYVDRYGSRKKMRVCKF